jgi:hypothetical protein
VFKIGIFEVLYATEFAPRTWRNGRAKEGIVQSAQNRSVTVELLNKMKLAALATVVRAALGRYRCVRSLEDWRHIKAG